MDKLHAPVHHEIVVGPLFLDVLLLVGELVPVKQSKRPCHRRCNLLSCSTRNLPPKLRFLHSDSHRGATVCQTMLCLDMCKVCFLFRP